MKHHNQLDDIPSTTARVQSGRKTLHLLTAVFLTGLLFILAHGWVQLPTNIGQLPDSDLESGICPQVAPLSTNNINDGLIAMEKSMNWALFRNRSISRLSDAVRIDTQVFDDLGPVGTDSRWDVFYTFASYLERTYPLVHGTLKLEKINTQGLVYTWSGEDPNLKPTLLLAHQDTSGFVDETNIWGRGSIDCKSQLTAILDAVEELISHGFKPRRTLLLAFGFDEEASGVQGARYIARFLQERYGKDSIAVIVDEGAPLQYKWGGLFALPIGILSDLVTAIESNGFRPWLDDRNPYLDQLRCGAAHGSRFPDKVRKLLRDHRERRPHETDALAEEIAKEGPRIRYLVQTSSAVDVISSGDKVNALPESASVKINYRINVGETVEEIQQHALKLATQTANKYNLTVNDFNSSSTAAIQTNSISPLYLTWSFQFESRGSINVFCK
ncbi:hypothetical protein BDV12DRAFT_195361 [Aspergillus spectabilis]